MISCDAKEQGDHGLLYGAATSIWWVGPLALHLGSPMSVVSGSAGFSMPAGEGGGRGVPFLFCGRGNGGTGCLGD